MIRLSKYPKTVVFVILTLLFVLQRWRFPNLHVKNLVLLPFLCLFVFLMLKLGLEGVADRKKIMGKLNNQQIALYRIAVGQLIGGIMGLLFLLYFALHLNDFLNPNL